MSNKVLVVIDMQNDFINGKLATPGVEPVVERVIEKITSFDGEIIYTLDTHDDAYASMNEYQHLPMLHCQKGTWGWRLESRIERLAEGKIQIEKPTFGSLELADVLMKMAAVSPIDSVEVVGLVTDICVLSNCAIMKAALPHTEIIVDATATAGTTPERKTTALLALEAIHVVVNHNG